MNSDVAPKQKYRWLAYVAIVIFLVCLSINLFSDRATLNTRFDFFGLSMTRFALNSSCSAIGMLLLCAYNYYATLNQRLKYFYIVMGVGALFLMWQSLELIRLAI
jgi:hypothetical protein